jgi:hypothetical protein
MSDSVFSTLFDETARWQVFASGLAEGRLSHVETPDGTAGLCLDYDFHGGKGFVAVRRLFAFALPDAFEIGFLVSGEGGANAFEFKLVSSDGENVWRYARPASVLPAAWTTCRVTERDLPFAWGPLGSGAPTAIGAIEFVVVADAGGKGTLQIARPSFENQTVSAPVAVRASSRRPGCAPEAVFDVRPSSEWRASEEDRQPWLEADFGRTRRFGGLVLRWPETRSPRTFEVRVSDDGHSWRSLYRAASVSGTLTHVPAPRTEARFLKLVFASAADAALRAVALRPDAFSQTPNAFIHAVAADFPRGWFPVNWLREQSYWTVVGAPEGTRRALIQRGGTGRNRRGRVLVGAVRADAGGTGHVGACGNAFRAAFGRRTGALRLMDDGRLSVVRPAWVDGRERDLTLHVAYRLTLRTPMPGFRLSWPFVRIK